LEDGIFTELENKLESLFAKVQNFKQEKNKLEQKIEEQKGIIEGLESEKVLIKKELEEVKNTEGIRQKKLDSAAEKIRKLLVKLDAVEG
jgi:predicted RNase H-like nuclease (RuvC/YqgF family)